MKKVLIVGSGGREHAIAAHIVQSAPSIELLFCQECAIPLLLPQARLSLGTPLEVAQREAVDLVLIGPEAPLVAGLADQLTAAGFAVFGPSQAAARLEGSKSFAKEFMRQYGVRTPSYRVYDCFEAAQDYLAGLAAQAFPLVLKADGLAAGKGVLICSDRAEAQEGIRRLMCAEDFGQAGATVLIEQYLAGTEASVLAFCDGNSIRPMLAAKDHKKIFDGERGPNTGGMGCVAPHPLLREGSPLWQDFAQQILAPTLHGIQQRSWDFSGIIFFGLMLCRPEPNAPSNCYLLEYNMRFGDPEAQTVLPLLRTPLLEIVRSCLMGRLDQQEITWQDAHSCTVVAAAAGYPQAPIAGAPIAGLSAAASAAGHEAQPGQTPSDNGLYLAGTSFADGVFRSSGGRVFACNATAKELSEARKRAYQKLQSHSFAGMQFRRDIGRLV